MAPSFKSSVSTAMLLMLLIMVNVGRPHDIRTDGFVHSPAFKQNNNKNVVISDDVSLQKAARICDDGQWNIQLDWEDKTSVEYDCQAGEKPLVNTEELKYKQECLLKKDIPRPSHICMNKKIKYLDTPPTAGPHRPQWPAYGEYRYLPPQRWVHSLEHGAAVFLYHPCADVGQIQLLKNIARKCLKKHIITPYREFSEGKLFAVITYGCRLQMNTVNELVVERFIQQHALQAPEGRVSRSGVYDYALLRSADTVSDENDSILCPNLDSENENIAVMIAENMKDFGEGTSNSHLY